MDREKQTDTIAPDDDLDDLLGPKPLSAREIQALVRQEKLGPGRVKGDKRSSSAWSKSSNLSPDIPVVKDACTMAGIHRATLGNGSSRAATAS
jgi:hypothetical protein